MRRYRKHEIPPLPTINLGGWVLDVTYWLNKEYTDIGQATVELPQLIEHINYHVQLQVEDKLKAEGELSRAEAKAYFALKQGEFIRKGHGDKPTEQALKYAISLDEEVIKLANEVAELTGWTERLRNLARTLQSKLELVRSNEATRRKLIAEEA
jgi:polyhydroxyalkanoate synthesis regulator phasin